MRNNGKTCVLICCVHLSTWGQRLSDKLIKWKRALRVGCKVFQCPFFLWGLEFMASEGRRWAQPHCLVWAAEQLLWAVSIWRRQDALKRQCQDCVFLLQSLTCLQCDETVGIFVVQVGRGGNVIWKFWITSPKKSIEVNNWILLFPFIVWLTNYIIKVKRKCINYKSNID